MGAIVAYFYVISYFLIERKIIFIQAFVFERRNARKYHPSISISGSGIVSLRVFDRDSLQSELLHERTQNSVKAKTQECQL